MEREGSSRFAFLSRGLAFLARPSVAVWAPIPLRLIVGYGFMEHGFAKLSRGPEAFAAILHTMGVPAPHLMAWLTILTELIGGLAVLLGAFVPLVSLPMAAVLFVAMLTVHLPYGFSSIKLLSVTSGRAQFGPPGYELICSILRALRRSYSVVLGRWRSTTISGRNDSRFHTPRRAPEDFQREVFLTRRVTNRTRSPR